MSQMSPSTKLTSLKIDLYACAACVSMSLAQTILTPKEVAPQSKPPQPENSETALNLVDTAVLPIGQFPVRSASSSKCLLESEMPRFLAFQPRCELTEADQTAQSCVFEFGSAKLHSKNGSNGE